MKTTLRELSEIGAAVFNREPESVYTMLRGYRDRGLLEPELSTGRGRTGAFGDAEIAAGLILLAASEADLGGRSNRLVAGAVKKGLRSALKGMRTGEEWVFRFRLRHSTEGFKYSASIEAYDHKPSKIIDSGRPLAAITEIRLNSILAPMLAA
ncbi:hypothetical protein [Hyphomonas sp. ND6WE1B]|uniref:hypothetical protein n=1 Tax=Hyphomonas sp. ND6WE1B TaxID=1848191 RepID=UPI0008075DF4|nr:hypothetical protein [Hyphomonas sp. ND6WE1B]